MEILLQEDTNKFAIYHTIYTDSNIFLRFDWNERVEDTIDCITNSKAYFLYDHDKILGGFVLKGNIINYPFVITPFDDIQKFLEIVLKFVIEKSGQNKIILNEISDAFSHVLVQKYGATLKWSKRKMVKPTEKYSPVLDKNFCFDILAIKDKAEIIKVIYEAHSVGYTSTVWKPDIVEIETAVERRFNSFGQTNTLYMSNVVRNIEKNETVGVCIAGIYPDSEKYSTGKFSTIHQISVKPQYQRRGIAKAMILKSISEANKVSPVMTLGVLVGNPAEIFYRDIGFSIGPSYSELVYSE